MTTVTHYSLETPIINDEDFSNVPEYGTQTTNVNQLQAERDRISKLEAENARMKDPTHRDAFDYPDIPTGYEPHTTDDRGVKAAGAALNKSITYLSALVSQHRAEQGEFEAVTSGRRQALADYQDAVSAAVAAGKEVPPLPALDDDALKAAHAELDRLEAGIPVAALAASQRLAELCSELERLHATPAYRKWADPEGERLTAVMAKARQEYADAYAEREAIFRNLPDAFSDADGVPFIPEQGRRNSLGVGGLDPNGGDGSLTPAEALSVLERAVTPGAGVRPWMASQLPPEIREDYEKRAAAARIKREGMAK
ncbi:hypothetical protein ACFPFX_09205 [Streptomyces mauvecolor]|uniref:Uncharacterized protein n=1 Tax=Streptomyces mauvecolor TaxID=58345 RepID=A0ABV9UL82_9ACTN